MSVRISVCWIFVNILLGFILFVNGEHFYLPKENNVFSNDLEDDWIPISGIDKRSTRQNHGLTQVVHITPPVRYPNRPLNQQSAASNKIEVFAQPPPTILGSFSEFGHATIEAREPAHRLNFRPSYNFDRYSEEINDRHFQQNDYHEPEDQKPPAIVVFNAQQRHPQNYHRLSPPPPPPPPPPQSSQPQQFSSNFQYHTINNNHNHNNNHNPNNNPKNFGFKEPPIIQDLPKRLPPYFVPNDHVYPRPQVNNKQVYAEQRPKPYLSSSVEPIQQPQQPFKSSLEVGSSGYFQKYPGHVESQNLFPQISNFARPFEQTNDHNVFIKPNQNVHNLNVGTEVRFGQDHGVQSTRPIPLELPTTGFTHPATRPFSKFQTPSPKNEELYRIFPVKEVNALPTFLPTPITLGQVVDGRPKVPYFKETLDGSSEYDAREEQDENESGEQYDIMKNPTKPMKTSTTTTTTSTTTAPPRATRKRKPSTTTTTTTTTIAPEEYEEYVVPNHSQNILQGQDHQQEYNLQQGFQPQEDYRHRHEYEITSTTEVTEKPMPSLVNKYKKKKPFPSSRPKEAQQPSVEELDLPERMTLGQSPTATVATTITTTPATTTTTTTTSPQPIAETTATTDARAKIKLKYGNSSRPRFSIKDYKSVTTTTTTTEKAPSVASRRSTTTTPASADPETVEHQQTTSSVRKPYKPRVRPNRYKMSSTTTTTTTAEEVQQQETATERVVASVTSYRSKYKPGKYYNRLRTSTESATTADEGSEQVVPTESTKPAVYSAKRRTASVGKTATLPSTVATAEESNALPLRRSSSITPPEILDVASSEDVDYVATTVSVMPLSSPKHKYHTSYVAERPLLPIESFFQSSMTSKRYHNERR